MEPQGLSGVFFHYLTHRKPLVPSASLPHDVPHCCGCGPIRAPTHTGGGSWLPWQLRLWLKEWELTFQFFLAWKRPLEKTALLPPSDVCSQLDSPGRPESSPKAVEGPGAMGGSHAAQWGRYTLSTSPSSCRVQRAWRSEIG